MRIIVACSLFASLFSCLESTELKPWFGIDKQLEIRPSYYYQTYRNVQTGQGTKRYSSDDHFVNLSLSASPDIDYNVELEAGGFANGRHHFCGNFESGTFRYLLLNDVIGDPISLVAGITFLHAHKPIVEDISVFYHGKYQFEGNLAIGKEFFCGEFWTNRIWTVFCAGIANEGSPWIRSNFAWETNWNDLHQFQLFANTLWGLGRHDLDLSVPFEGYGSINHQSIDLGAQYSTCFLGLGTLDLGYAYRVYIKNGPSGASLAYVRLMIPFNF